MSVTAVSDIQIRRAASPLTPLLQAVAVALIGFLALGGIAWYVYSHAENSLIEEIRSGLERTARIAAHSIDAGVHGQFTRPEQKETPEYQQAIKPLREIMRADPEVSFAYSAILSEGKVYFILDATPAESDTAVQIMQQYDPPPPDLLLALKDQKAVVSREPYTDEWGTFISAYEPLFTADKRFIGVLGVDLTTKNYEARLRPIRHSTFVAMGLAGAIALAMGLAVWVQRKTDRNLHEAGRQLKIVNALLNVSRALGSNTGIKNILPVIVNKTTEVMNAERTSLFLYDRERHTLKGRVLEGLDEDSALRISDERGIVGRVARSGQPANVPDPAADPDFDAGFDKEFGFRTRNMLVVPVMDTKQKVIAVLQALNRRGDAPFDDDDRVLMNALAAQAQVALERETLNQSVLEKQKLEDTLKFAQTIQMGMLPTRFPDRDRYIELHALLIPAKLVGGDFYDFIDLGDGLLGLVIADVSGKGMPAALLMAKAMTLVRAFATVGIAPSEILRQSNEELARDNDAAMFVTVFIAIVDRRSGQMVYANGGHNAPLLVRKGVVQELNEADSVPLGTMPAMIFVEARIQLEPDDLLYLFTDGVNEAMSPEYQEFGDARMQDVVLAHAHRSPFEINHEMIQAVRQHANGAEQSDDITLLTVRWKGP